MISVKVISKDERSEEETRMANAAVELAVLFASEMVQQYNKPGLVIFSLISAIVFISKTKRPPHITQEEALDDVLTGVRNVFRNMEMRDVTAHYQPEGGKA